MEISTLQIIAIFIFSCIAGMGSVLDEFQTHRPLIACTVIGLILGDLKTGVMLGGTLELIALGWMNVGAAQSPDSALASIISAILVIVGQQSIATGIAIALPVAAAGQVLTVFARRSLWCSSMRRIKPQKTRVFAPSTSSTSLRWACRRYVSPSRR